MITSLLFLLSMASTDLPKPLTQEHQDKIACVALLAIIASEQARDAIDADQYPDVREIGRKWAGLVGDRVMFETGQPQEVVAFAMKEAVKSEQARVQNVIDPKAVADARVAECMPLMQTDLAANAAEKSVQ